ncbi:MAG: Methionine aminopeptidase [Candidatus Curtissbacteria bacterium GW2011_GWA1_40_9]|uniref:Methionine aminopeptidase n=1 Tax=Candidatus Curtissbacteria bacterium GW2011_GWA1_40_9 TaxID=1618408 RepID=A0A0G0TLZ7_9BACT|nr:MAG: Methionine aminopeptidase [Candidatus Curtissbacteria bacterium GW2011_GWA1_40_9]
MVKNNFVKTNEEIEIMKKSGKICAQALRKVLDNVKVGISCNTLDIIAQEEVEKLGATPSFKTVEDYKYTICTTVNAQVVHGLPTNRILQDGDIIGIDIGALYNGFHSDLAISVPVGKITKDEQKFLDIGKNTLQKAINEAKVGNRIGDISATIQEVIEGAGYSIVKSLTGHGIGKELHEEPMIPGFGKKGTGSKILENMTIAIEVIYAQGSGEVGLEKDNWTISTKDNSLGGLFEKTIAVKGGGPIVLTPYL